MQSILIPGAVVYSSSSSFGPGSGPVLLSNVRCAGSETNMLECRNTMFVGSYCSHDRDVGLRCEGKTITTICLSINAWCFDEHP